MTSAHIELMVGIGYGQHFPDHQVPKVFLKHKHDSQTRAAVKTNLQTMIAVANRRISTVVTKQHSRCIKKNMSKLNNCCHLCVVNYCTTRFKD